MSVYLKIFLTVFIWGASWPAGRVVVLEIQPLTAASWRFVIAVIAIGIVFFRREGIPRWHLKEWALLSAVGVFGVFLYNLFFLYGLRHVEAGRGALMVALSPIFIALCDRWLFKKKLHWVKTFGIALALLGGLLVISRGHPTALLKGEFGFYDLVMFGCTLSWVAYTFLIRKAAKHFSPLAITFGSCLAGGLMLIACALVEGSLFALSPLSVQGWFSLVFLGLFTTALAFLWYSDSVKKLGVTTTVVFLNLVPVFALAMSALWLAEKIGLFMIFGGALVVCGVILTNLSLKAAPR